MSGSPLMLAIWNLALLAALGAFVWAFAWALFGDRHFRSPRCPRCWHDMSAATSMLCTECGFVAPYPEALHRRRRRWMVALASLALMLGLALHLRTNWSQTGWTAMVPDRFSIWALPSISPDGALRELFEEVGDRFARGRLATANAQRVLERIIEGDDGARPGTPAWNDKYGRLLDRWAGSGRYATFFEATVPPEILALEARLAELPPVCSITPPAVWVVDEPLPLELMISRPWGARLPQRVIVEATTLPASSSNPLPPVDRPIVLTSPGPMTGRVPLLFEPLPEGLHFGTVRVVVETQLPDGRWTRSAPFAAPVDVRIRSRMPIPMQRVADAKSAGVDDSATATATTDPARGGFSVLPDPISDTIAEEDPTASFEPHHSVALDDAVRSLAAPGLVRWARGERRFAMRFEPWARSVSPLSDTALGFEAEILEDGVVRRRLRAWWSSARGLRFEPPVEDPTALERANIQDGRWTLRVRGVRDLAVRSALMGSSMGRRYWWDGEVTIPLRVEDIDTEAPPRGWKLAPLDDDLR